MTYTQLMKELNGATEITITHITDDCEAESWPVHTVEFDINGICIGRRVENEGSAAVEMPAIGTIGGLIDWVLTDQDNHDYWVDAHAYWDEQTY